MQMKVGTVELDTDPAPAFTDFQIALQRIESLPPAEQGSLSAVRIRAMVVAQGGTCLERVGRIFPGVAVV
jgi:hypothetical protein